MRRWIARQMFKPWVTAIGCTALFVAGMLGLRWLAHSIVDQGGAGAIWAVNAVWIPALLLYGIWSDRRRGY